MIHPATPQCVLHRPFGIRQLVQGGFRPMLIRDMTEPSSDHYAGQDTEQLLGEMINYVETFYAPTVHSRDLIEAMRY